MKKNKLLILGMFAMVLTLGLAFVGCNTDGGEPNTDPKSIRITGFNENKTRLFVYVMHDINDDLDSDLFVYSGGFVLSDQNEYTIALKTTAAESWTGTGKYFIMIQVEPANGGQGRSAFFYSVDGINPALIDIEDAVTTLEWSKFVYWTEHTGAG
jgi:hypothetical protein